MVKKKKGVKKKVSKKKVSRKRVKNSYRSSKKFVRSTKDKRKLVVSKLIFFVILFIASFLIYSAASTDIYRNLFGLFAILFGFLSLALVLVLIIFYILKLLEK